MGIQLQAPPRPTLRSAVVSWTPRQRWSAVIAAVLIALAIGLPTDVIPNPVFGRPVPVTWWSYPILALTAVLGGLLFATYVRPARSDRVDIDAAITSEPGTQGDAEIDIDPSMRSGGIGGLLSFFAVGCPVCNKLVVVALGTTGARQWFEPVQPVLAVASVALLAYALRARLRSFDHCAR